MLKNVGGIIKNSNGSSMHTNYMYMSFSGIRKLEIENLFSTYQLVSTVFKANNNTAKTS